MDEDVQVTVLGELALWRGGRAVVLPPSRKTRALLAYLILTGRPHRRERLCEVFWELPDDPRGALRWSLSKIRGLVGTERVIADRERVSLSTVSVRIDLVLYKERLADGGVALAELREMAVALSQPLLDGLDLPQQDPFQSWLVAVREEAVALWFQVLGLLLAHPDRDEHEAVNNARAWLAVDPLALTAARALVAALRQSGRGVEAAEAAQAFRHAALEAGLNPVPDPEAPADIPPFVPPEPVRAHHQTIGFCVARDGARIAYAVAGSGPPLVKAANWLNHLELDFNSPIWGRTFEALARRNTLIRYDERGNGLSDWEVPEISQPAFVQDLETVVDTLGLSRFPLLGMSQGCAVSVEYAVRHPERVTGLILIGGYAQGWRIGASVDERERREAVMTLTRLGWGTSHDAYRQIFSHTFMPDGTAEDFAYFDQLQRLTTSAENAVRFQDAFGDIDVQALLSQVRVPVLVMHARDDQRISLQQGLGLAAGIPNARFVTLESRNHIILGHEPAWSVMLSEIERFIATI